MPVALAGVGYEYKSRPLGLYVIIAPFFEGVGLRLTHGFRAELTKYGNILKNRLFFMHFAYTVCLKFSFLRMFIQKTQEFFSNYF